MGERINSEGLNWGSRSLLHFLSEDGLEGEGDELVPCALVELVLELHPMQSQSVQEALHGVHQHEHEECH